LYLLHWHNTLFKAICSPWVWVIMWVVLWVVNGVVVFFFGFCVGDCVGCVFCVVGDYVSHCVGCMHGIFLLF
ncbi:hypothetical protein, partial [Escherichia coli]|uniref:hypothetical protein n=1 Tax=Escherichia coli TaxID=562 RepID=UPI001BDCE906